MMGDDKTPSRSYAVLRPQQLRDVNGAAVLRHLIAAGPTPRLEIAAALGLTQGPITRIVGRLTALGLVRESVQRATAPGVRGRPKVPVEVIPDAFAVLGAHIGVEHVTVGVTGIDGRVRSGSRVDYDGSWSGARRVITEFARAARLDSPALGLGVIIGGHVDPRRGLLVSHEALGWSSVPMHDELAAEVDHAVFIESSVRAHASADILFGVAAGVHDFVHLFVGNVIEIAIVRAGAVTVGRSGGNGDLSQWLVADPDGRSVPAITALGDRAVVRRARDAGLIEDEAAGLDAVVAAAERGDGTAREILLDRARGVGKLLAQVDSLLGPELIVISSGVLAVDGTIEAAAEVLTAEGDGPAEGRAPAVRASRYGTNPLVSAAAALVLERTLFGSAATPFSKGISGHGSV